MKTFSAFVVALSCALSSASLMAKTVDAADISPQDAKASVKTPAVTLLLLNSPDPNCGYCRGQAQLFDELARTHPQPLRMRRVSWSPWREMPAQSNFPEPVYGVPTWQVFRDGKLLGQRGQIKDLATLSQFVDDAVNGRLSVPKPMPPASKPKAAPSTAPAAPLTDVQRRALSVMVRGDLARDVLGQCGKAHPSEASSYTQAMSAYDARHKADLRRAGMLMLTRSDATIAQDMKPIINAETQRWKDEAPMDQPTVEGCRKVVQGLGR